MKLRNARGSHSPYRITVMRSSQLVLQDDTLCIQRSIQWNWSMCEKSKKTSDPKFIVDLIVRAMFDSNRKASLQIPRLHLSVFWGLTHFHINFQILMKLHKWKCLGWLSSYTLARMRFHILEFHGLMARFQESKEGIRCCGFFQAMHNKIDPFSPPILVFNPFLCEVWALFLFSGLCIHVSG
jgi:hypothetical protein